MHQIILYQQEFDKELSNLDKKLGSEVEIEFLTRWVQLLFKLLFALSDHYEPFEEHVLQTTGLNVMELLELAPDVLDTKQESPEQDTKDEEAVDEGEHRNEPHMENISDNQVSCELLSRRLVVDVGTQCASLHYKSVGIGTENAAMECTQTQTESVDGTSEKDFDLSLLQALNTPSCCEDMTNIVKSPKIYPVLLSQDLAKSEKQNIQSPPQETSTNHSAAIKVESLTINPTHPSHVSAELKKEIALPRSHEVSTSCVDMTNNVVSPKTRPPPPSYSPTKSEKEIADPSPPHEISKNGEFKIKMDSPKIDPGYSPITSDKVIDLLPPHEITRVSPEDKAKETSSIILHAPRSNNLTSSTNGTPLSPIAVRNDVSPLLEKQAVNNVLSLRDNTNQDVNNDAPSDSDSSITKKSPTFSKAQQETWKKKKTHIYERSYYSSPSPCEVKIRQKRKALRRGSVPRQVMTKTERKLLTRMPSYPEEHVNDDEDSVWIVAKAKKLKNTKRNDISMLQILHVSDKSPCLVPKKTIGVLVLNNFNLSSCLK